MWPKIVRYLDYNASSLVSDSVRNQLVSLLQSETVLFANPSSKHRLGQRAMHLFLEASTTIAESLGVRVTPENLIFTSSGTEANQTVIQTLSKSCDGIIIGSGEHSASFDLITEVITPWMRELSLSPNGQYNLEELKFLLAEAKNEGLTSIGISLFWANNETGVISDLPALQAVMAESGINCSLHLDGAQIWGKLECDVSSTPANFITFSAHKIGAPAGLGLIWAREPANLIPLIPGNQNRGLRGGTENLLGIIAAGFAARAISIQEFQNKTAALQARLEAGLKKSPDRFKIWGANVPRVTNTTRFSILGEGSYAHWVELLDLRGFAVSHGSACRAQIIEPSRVLLNMGASREEALNSIRVSFGPGSTVEDVDGLLAAIHDILAAKERLANESRVDLS